MNHNIVFPRNIKKSFFIIFLSMVLLFYLTGVAQTLQANATTIQPNDNKPAFKAGEVIVKFKSSNSTMNISSFAENNGLAVEKQLPLVNNASLMKIKNGEKVSSILQRLKKNSLIEWAQPNYYYYPDATPADPYWDDQWGLHNTGQYAGGSYGTSDVDIDALEAWSNSANLSTVTVAVIDTGTDINHPDLTSNLWTNSAELNGTAGIDDDGNGYIDDIYGWDFAYNDNTVFDSESEDDHGTHVSGIIAGTHNDIGIRGVASNVKIMPLKFINANGGYTTDAIEAINYASSMGAQIINASWGGPSYDSALKDAIANSGTIFVAAAGNGGSDGIGDDNDTTPMYPASYSVSNIISVAAIDNDGNLASFSNYGSSTVDVGAPGVDIFSTYPNNQYMYMSGTSMAAPMVSGVAGGLLGKNPNLSTGKVIDLIKNTGAALSSLSGKTVTGKLVNFNNALAEVLPPKGSMDAPADGDTVSDTITVSGWFLDGNGVEKVEVLVDGAVVGTATYGYQRLDVSSAFPDYKNDHSGFKYNLDTNTLTNGDHTISIRETAKTGAQATLTSRTISVNNTLPPKGRIDKPADGDTVSDTIEVAGWFLDGEGVQKVEVLVDGAVVGTATYGYQRLDVSSSFPEYNNDNSGYKFSLDTTILSNGDHSITVRETSDAGNQTTLSNRTITVNNLPPKGRIDKPADGDTVSDTITVAGWFLDGDGVQKVEVLVDGAVVGTATYGYQRLDVSSSFPEYNNDNSGYKFNLDTTTLADGDHSITVRETSKTGNQTTLSNRTITVKNLPPKGRIDKPADGDSVSDTITVAGWFLDGDGVQKVEVLVDGAVVGTATYGYQRLDVSSSFPEYNNDNSGYKFNLDTTTLADGDHSITVRETSKTGNQSTLSNRTITVKNLPPKGNLDKPTDGDSVSGTINIAGWFLDGDGVQKIEVLIDGNVIGEANYGIQRLDVSSAFPEYNNDNSGYKYALDTTTLTNGDHTITIRETSGAGSQTSLKSITITVSN